MKGAYYTWQDLTSAHRIRKENIITTGEWHLEKCLLDTLRMAAAAGWVTSKNTGNRRGNDLMFSLVSMEEELIRDLFQTTWTNRLQVGLSICTEGDGKRFTSRLPKREYISQTGFLMIWWENEEIEELSHRAYWQWRDILQVYVSIGDILPPSFLPPSFLSSLPLFLPSLHPSWHTCHFSLTWFPPLFVFWCPKDNW